MDTKISTLAIMYAKILKKPKSWRPSWKMASVEKVRQIQMNHIQFSEPPGWVQPPKSGFASNLEMHTN